MSKLENLLSIQDGNQELRNIHQGVFPTTWLARKDALVQVRATLFGAKDIQIKKIVKESYKTTPRHVVKVNQIQSKAVPSLGRKHELWFAYHFSKSIFQKLLGAKKYFRANLLP